MTAERIVYASLYVVDGLVSARSVDICYDFLAAFQAEFWLHRRSLS